MKKEKMMMNQTMNKQMTEFTRTTMDNTTKALAALQEQTEKMTNMFIDMLALDSRGGEKDSQRVGQDLPERSRRYHGSHE